MLGAISTKVSNSLPLIAFAGFASVATIYNIYKTHNNIDYIRSKNEAKSKTIGKGKYTIIGEIGLRNPNEAYTQLYNNGDFLINNFEEITNNIKTQFEDIDKMFKDIDSLKKELTDTFTPPGSSDIINLENYFKTYNGLSNINEKNKYKESMFLFILNKSSTANKILSLITTIDTNITEIGNEMKSIKNDKELNYYFTDDTKFKDLLYDIKDRKTTDDTLKNTKWAKYNNIKTIFDTFETLQNNIITKADNLKKDKDIKSITDNKTALELDFYKDTDKDKIGGITEFCNNGVLPTYIKNMIDIINDMLNISGLPDTEKTSLSEIKTNHENLQKNITDFKTLLDKIVVLDTSYNKITSVYEDKDFVKKHKLIPLISHAIHGKYDIEKYISDLKNITLKDTSTLFQSLKSNFKSGDSMFDENTDPENIMKEGLRIQEIMDNRIERYKLIFNKIELLHFIKDNSMKLFKSIYNYINTIIKPKLEEKINDAASTVRTSRGKAVNILYDINDNISSGNNEKLKELYDNFNKEGSMEIIQEFYTYCNYAKDVKYFAEFILTLLADEVMTIMYYNDLFDPTSTKWTSGTVDRFVYPDRLTAYEYGTTLYNSVPGKDDIKNAALSVLNFLWTKGSAGNILSKIFSPDTYGLGLLYKLKTLVGKGLITIYDELINDKTYTHVEYLKHINALILQKNLKDWISKSNAFTPDTSYGKELYDKINALLIDEKIRHLQKCINDTEPAFDNTVTSIIFQINKFIILHDFFFQKLYIKIPELAPILGLFDTTTGNIKFEVREEIKKGSLGEINRDIMKKNKVQNFFVGSARASWNMFKSKGYNLQEGYGINPAHRIYVKEDDQLTLQNFLNNNIYIVCDPEVYNDYLFKKDKYIQDKIKGVAVSGSMPTPPPNSIINELWIDSTDSIYIIVMDPKDAMKEVIQKLHKCIQRDIMAAKTITADYDKNPYPVKCNFSVDLDNVAVAVRNPSLSSSSYDDTGICYKYPKNMFLQIPRSNINDIIKKIKELRNDIVKYHEKINTIAWIPSEGTTHNIYSKTQEFIKGTEKIGSHACADILDRIIEMLEKNGILLRSASNYMPNINNSEILLFILNYDRSSDKYFTQKYNSDGTPKSPESSLKYINDKYPKYTEVNEYPENLDSKENVYRLIANIYRITVNGRPDYINDPNGFINEFNKKYPITPFNPRINNVTNVVEIIKDFEKLPSDYNNYLQNMSEENIRNAIALINSLTCKYVPSVESYRDTKIIGRSYEVGGMGETEFTENSMSNWVNYLVNYLDFEQNPQLIEKLFFSQFQELNDKNILQNIYDNINIIVGYQIQIKDGSLESADNYGKLIQDLLVGQKEGGIMKYFEKNDKHNNQAVHFLKSPLMKLYAINALNYFNVNNIAYATLEDINKKADSTDIKNNIVSTIKMLKRTCLEKLVREHIRNNDININNINIGKTIINIYNYFFNRTDDVKKTIIYLKMFSNKYNILNGATLLKPQDRYYTYGTTTSNKITIHDITNTIDQNTYISTIYLPNVLGTSNILDRNNSDIINKLLIYCVGVHHALFIPYGRPASIHRGLDALIDLTLNMLLKPNSTPGTVSIKNSDYHDKTYIDRSLNNDIDAYIGKVDVQVSGPEYISPNTIKRIQERFYLYDIPAEIKYGGGTFKTQLINAIKSNENNTIDSLINKLIEHRSTYPWLYLIKYVYSINNVDDIINIFKYIIKNLKNNIRTIGTATDPDYNVLVTSLFNNPDIINKSHITTIGYYNINTNLDVSQTIVQLTKKDGINKISPGELNIKPTFKTHQVKSKHRYYIDPEKSTRTLSMNANTTGSNKKKLHFKTVKTV